MRLQILIFKLVKLAGKELDLRIFRFCFFRIPVACPNQRLRFRKVSQRARPRCPKILVVNLAFTACGRFYRLYSMAFKFVTIRSLMPTQTSKYITNNRISQILR